MINNPGDRAVPKVTIDNTTCYYRLSDKTGSDNKTAVFIHGAGGDGSVWEYQLKLLGKACKLIVPDLPGHGKSEGDVFATAAKYAYWLDMFTEKLKIPSFFLAGHSLGGAIVQEFARAFPKKVKGLILAGTGARFNILKEYLLLILRDFETAVKTSCASAYSLSVTKELYEKGYEMLRKNGKKVLYGDMLTCDQFNSTVWISSVRNPAIVICGSEDKITPCVLSRDISRHIAGSQLKVIPGAGHMVMMEAPEEFNNSVLRFMDKKRPETLN